MVAVCRRLLRPGRRCLVGIADNREHCYVVPVAFTTLATYLNAGLVLEELVGRRRAAWPGPMQH
jgi:hypothetical protein